MPDADELFDGEGVEDLGDGVFGDAGVAIGLVYVGSELGEELVGSDADRAGEVELGFDEPTDFDGDIGGRAEEMGRAGDIEEGFVDGDGLDGWRESFEDFEDLFGDFGVGAVRSFDEDGVRAEPLGDG